jgi:hypothetical protein
VTIIDPATGQPFPGNRIPQSRFSPIAQSVLSNQTLYPSPNRAGDTDNFVSASSDKIRTYQGDAKLDWNASPRIACSCAARTSTTRPSRTARRSRASSRAARTRRSSAWRRTGRAP